MFLHPTFVWQNIRVSYQQQVRPPKWKIILFTSYIPQYFLLQGQNRVGIDDTYFAYQHIQYFI